MGVSVEDLEEMVSHGELPMVRVGTRRRLIRVSEVEAILERVGSGGRLRTRGEFRAESVERAAHNASRYFGVAVDRLEFEVLDRGSPWAVGMRSSPARILVEIPEEIPDDFLPRPRVTMRRGASDRQDRGLRGAEEARSGFFYAPGQAARLLGMQSNREDLWSLGEKLAWVTINDYRWIPVEAVEVLAKELSPPRLDDPPRPFRILLPRGGSPRPGKHEISQSRQPATGDRTQRERGLEIQVAELERNLRELRAELRLERLRRAEQLQGQTEDAGPGPRAPAAGSDPSPELGARELSLDAGGEERA